MTCDCTTSNVTALSPSRIHTSSNTVTGNVTVKCLANITLQISIPDMRKICRSSFPHLPLVDMSGGEVHNRRNSNDIQNADDFVIANHQQQRGQDSGQDSGFSSAGNFKNYLLSCRIDHQILSSNEKQLWSCEFYYPHLDSDGAMKKLRHSVVGTFLIRNSFDARFLFSLSVKTQRGATSVRIAYQDGWFSFDCDARIRKRMPRFHSVLELVDHYVDLSRKGMDNSWRWEEKSGRKNLVVEISKPCRTSVPSLQRLSAIVINQQGSRIRNCIAQNPFKPENKKALEYLREYPFKV